NVLDEFPVGDLFALGRTQTEGLCQDPAFHAQVAARHDVVEHAHALEQGQVLEGTRNAHFGGAARIHFGELHTGQGDFTLLRRIDAVDDVEHGTFAGAVGAYDGPDFMFLDV